MSDNIDIIKNFNTLGLGFVESKIYLYLLESTSKTILELSRDLNIPRTSVYDNCFKLLGKGLLEKEVEYKTQRFKASSIKLLEVLIDKEKAKTKELEEAYNQIKQNLSSHIIPSAVTRVRYYRGASGFMQMLWNTMDANRKTIGYSEFGRSKIVGKKFIEKLKEENIRKKIRDRVITNPNKEIFEFLKLPEEKNRELYQATRFISNKELFITGDTIIYNNIFAVSYWKQGEVVGVEIENEELVKTQKSIFEILWEKAERINIYGK